MQMFSGGRGSYDPAYAARVKAKREKRAMEEKMIQVAREAAREAAYKAVFNSFKDEMQQALNRLEAARQALEIAQKESRNADEAHEILITKRERAADKAASKAEEIVQDKLEDKEPEDGFILPPAAKLKARQIKPIPPDDSDDEFELPDDLK